MIKQFKEILEEHGPDLEIYDSYSLIGCTKRGCWKRSDDEAPWDAYHDHLVELLNMAMVEFFNLDKLQCVDHMDGEPGEPHFYGGWHDPHKMCVPDKEES